MQISEIRLQQYIDLYYKRYNKIIDKNQALLELTALVTLLKTVQLRLNK